MRLASRIATTFFSSALALSVFIACDSVPLKPASNTAEGLFAWAKQFEEAERYIEAIDQYGVVKNKFPYSRYAILAELAMADIHFKRESFLEAQNAYQTFKDLHPKHKKIDYVTFRLAMSFFYQLPSTIDRDLSLARQAILYFDEVITLYPASEHIDEASKKKIETQNMLAEKAFYIARFYLKQKQHLSALKRFQYILKTFQRDDQLVHALYGAIQSSWRLGEKKLALAYFKQLSEKYPKADEVELAKNELDL